MPRDVFVSHASEDHALAEQVCALLEQRGLKCWIAPRDVFFVIAGVLAITLVGVIVLRRHIPPTTRSVP